MISSSEVVAHEESLFERFPLVRAAFTESAEAGHAAVVALVARYDALGSSDLTRFNDELTTIRREALNGYASKVRKELPDDEIALWRSRVAELPGSSAAIVAECGAPGALSLFDALDEAPDPVEHSSLDEALRAGADICSCEYARTRAVPRRLCPICSTALLDAWCAEEQRLLAQAPLAAASVNAVIEQALTELAKVALHPEEGMSDTLRIVRRRAGRHLARTAKSHRDEAAQLDVAGWIELAELNGRSYYTEVRGDARRYRRWRLGAARLSSLGLAGNAELIARMKLLTTLGTAKSER